LDQRWDQRLSLAMSSAASLRLHRDDRRENAMAGSDPVAELDGRFSDTGAVATPWADTLRVIDRAELFWISTVRVDGQPHVTPLPAVWQDGVLHFCTGAGEQKGVNLVRNAHCTLTTGNNA
jgi:hypothetical protein